MNNMCCPEGYSDKARIIPLIKLEHCLNNHRQCVCSTCSRCICTEVDSRGNYRTKFPFRTAEIAKLYPRSIEVINQGPCSICEMKISTGRCFYKIFHTAQELYDL